jgi:hypothetical protein
MVLLIDQFIGPVDEIANYGRYIDDIVGLLEMDGLRPGLEPSKIQGRQDKIRPANGVP